MLPVIIYSGLVGGAILSKFVGNRGKKFDPTIHQYPNDLNVKNAVKLIKEDFFDYILDVRTQNEFNQGNLDKSILIESLAYNHQKIKDVEFLIKDKTKKILIYCRSGRRALNAAKLLKAYNYDNVYYVKNGGYIELSKSI